MENKPNIKVTTIHSILIAILYVVVICLVVSNVSTTKSNQINQKDSATKVENSKDSADLAKDIQKSDRGLLSAENVDRDYSVGSINLRNRTYPDGFICPEDRSKLDFDSLGIQDIPSNRKEYTGELKYTTLQVKSINFAGDNKLAYNVATNDKIGKELVILFENEFTSEEYQELNNIMQCLPNLVLNNGSTKINLNSYIGTTCGANLTAVYCELQNDEVKKLKKGNEYKVEVDKSSESRVTLDIPEGLTVKLEY